MNPHLIMQQHNLSTEDHGMVTMLVGLLLNQDRSLEESLQEMGITKDDPRLAAAKQIVDEAKEQVEANNR